MYFVQLYNKFQSLPLYFQVHVGTFSAHETVFSGLEHSLVTMTSKGTPSQAKLLVCLEQVKQTWLAVKVLWLNVLLILYWFYKATFFDTITSSSWGDCHVVHSFSCASFWHHEVSGTADRTPEALSCDRSQMKCMWIAIIFLTDCFYLLSELLLYCSILEKKLSPWGKVRSIGFCPNLLLIRNDW